MPKTVPLNEKEYPFEDYRILFPDTECVLTGGKHKIGTEVRQLYDFGSYLKIGTVVGRISKSALEKCGYPPNARYRTIIKIEQIIYPKDDND